MASKILMDIKNVSFAYFGKIALSHVSISFNKGDSFMLIGANGSGKSTLLKLINGIIFPDEGSYFFDGNLVTKNTMKDRKFAGMLHKRIGFLFQNSENQLFCSNVYEEVAFGPRQLGLPEEEVEKRVYDCMNMLEITKIKHREPYHLSDGEKKRVALASVLAMNPEILTLDEPMNGLDPKSKRFIRELLIELHKTGKTLICATHDFTYVDGIFSKAAVFSENHNIVRKGKSEGILDDKNFLSFHNII